LHQKSLVKLTKEQLTTLKQKIEGEKRKLLQIKGFISMTEWSVGRGLPLSVDLRSVKLIKTRKPNLSNIINFPITAIKLSSLTKI